MEESSIPEGWKEVKLGKYIKLKNGYAFKSKEFLKSGIPLVKISNIQNNKSICSNRDSFISDCNLDKLKQFILGENDFVIAMSGATTGKIGLITKDFSPSFLNQRVGKFETINDDCILKFIYYYFNQEKVIKKILENASSSAQPNISPPFIENLKINLPTLKEQEKIAQILTNVDKQIEKTQEIISKSEEIKQGLMQELLVKGIGHKEFKEVIIGPKTFSIPKTWNVFKIEETSTLKGRIGWQGLTTKEYLDEGDYYLITGTDFKEGKIKWETCHYVEKERFDQDKYIQIKEKDIYITKDGTIGKVAIIDKLPNKPATLNSGVFVLRQTNGSYIPEYMYWILKSSHFKNFINGIKAGSTIAHLYQRDFYTFQFICPSIKEQEQIATILSNVDNEIQKEKSYLKELQETKKGLMQDLLTGKVIV